MFIIQILAIALVLAAVSYAGFRLWTFAFELNRKGYFTSANTARLLSAFVMALAFVAVAMPASVGAVFAQSTIDFDLEPFFTSLNTYLPIFIGLFAIVGGIAGAMALARYVIGAVVRAFSGGTI
jgi:hypothetical protein